MRLQERSVFAVIPTRGDVPAAEREISEHLSRYPEIAVIRFVVGKTTFNRYLEAERSKQAIIYTQDDDCITDIRPILEAYEPGIIVNAMTPAHQNNYRGSQTLIGFGAVFDKALIRSVMERIWIRDELFYSKSDRIFTTVNRHKTVFPEIQILPHASAPNRLYRESDHSEKVAAMNERIYRIKGIRAND